MVMPMMQIRQMRVCMRHRFMHVSMRVRFRTFAAIVRMPVVRIVHMPVRVLKMSMYMRMPVIL